jgi:GT2 family glycosyltransferase
VTTIPEFPGRYHVRRDVTAEPLVSIIIPFRDEPAMLATCARTLRADPGYANFELVLVDNDSALPETSALLAELRAEPRVRVLEAPGPFNWAAINNAAARACDGDILLFLNNDIEARTPGWLNAMVGHAQRPEVGAVGARLLYADGTIQHAGVVVGLGGIAGHVLRGLPGDRPGYNSLAISTRDCSVVTGAAMMVRRELFLELGGFDETLAVAFNDVDFCFKLREHGYYIVFTPLAELIHHESKSRGHTDDFAENELMLARWGAALSAGDPYHNEHLSHWRYWCPLSTAQEDDRWKNYLETRIPTLVSSSSG